MKLRSLLAALAMVLMCAAAARPQDLSGLPPYQPRQQVSGTLRSWGHGYLKTVMSYWESDFKRYQPGITFEDTLVSSAAAMAGLYTGRADLGVLAREITPPEVAAYEKLSKQPVFAVQVLTGSFGNQDKVMALGVFVNADNPIKELTFSQLDAIFGYEHKRGAPAIIRTWDQLGLSGRWHTRAIQPYSGLAFEAPGVFFSHTVMGGSVLWNGAVQQFDNVEVGGTRSVDAYQRVVDAVGADRYGIGIAGAGYVNPRARLLALALDEHGPYVAATKDNVASRRYPLARPVRFYIDKGPAKAADPRVIEFLRYILSREGQQQALRDGDFMPLTAEVARAELQRLE